MIEKLKHLEIEIDKVVWGDALEIDKIINLLILIIKKSITDNDSYFNQIHDINTYFYNSTEARWNYGIGLLRNLIELIIEDIELSQNSAITPKAIAIEIENEVSKSNKVFIVHGHDEEIKQSVARTVEVLDLEPIILHEQADSGKTVIEKFEENSSDVGFAIVLFTPDDLAYSANESHENAKYRARQNVILELGYFTGKLSRKNVMVIFRKSEDFEIPSDFAGVIYTPYDAEGNWKFKLCKELISAGFDVDSNKLLK